MNPFASIWEDDVPQAPKVQASPKIKSKPKVDHTDARNMYDLYMRRKPLLMLHQDYADRVAAATHGQGMTLVQPLATMGCGGGPLLCDHCLKPIVLEGGKYHGWNADVGWAANPDPKWKSWIKGGMVVQIVCNGTLRIYHGYSHNANDCCTLANQEMERAEAAFKRDDSAVKKLVAFLEAECPGQLNALLSDIVSVLLSYDPGLGVNGP